ncbi:MAG: hypothetical protein AUK23_11670 [Deltaproteobacteria bacterium CG2_30_43_15]|nr:MAG: hypothetical protein AUK23_11670 [Deltaproteobacteria bacterium CG2_30_43_15]
MTNKAIIENIPNFMVNNFDEVVKSQKSDGTVKSSRCKARKSEGMRRTYLYAAMTEDAAERRRWTFYEAVNFRRELMCLL